MRTTESSNGATHARALVTGCAGFLGSQLCEALVACGTEVVGVDCFSDYYPRPVKQANLRRLLGRPDFRLVDADLAVAPLEQLVGDTEVIYHLAGQPGVRPSFGDGFGDYLRHNVQATQRLLEAAVAVDSLQAFVYASSSSVYGDQDVYPVREDAPLRPVSPYGSTKVITEQLADAFWRSQGVPVTGLRYFTVYGPRQRPDMAFTRFLERALSGRPLTILGDGRQVREFTYVDDVVRATISAGAHGERGAVYNVGGGEPVALLSVIEILEGLLGRSLAREHHAAAPGDPRRTAADIGRATRDLGYTPATSIAAGLSAQIETLRDRVGTHVSVHEHRGRPTGVTSRRAAAPSASGAPRLPCGQGGPTVLAYSHDGYGLGHLRRNLRLLNGLRRQRPDVRAVLATGARSAERVVAPFSMTCVSLPSVVKVANGRYAVDGQGGTLADVMRVRSDALADAVRRYQPALLLVDRYPRGMHEELEAALAAYRAERPGAPAVLGLRDILDHPSVIAREWREQRHSDTIRDLYDAVLCYGDPAVFDSVGEYGLPIDVAERVIFTGYLADELLATEAGAVRRRHTGGDERLAVCTLGGGKDAAFIAEAFIAAVARLQPAGWSGVLITGPYMAAEDVRRLRAQATGTSVIRMVDHVPDYLAAADAVVCMGGYNTTCEVLALAAPAVVVPRVHPRQEQLMRAERLGARGLVRWLHPASLSPRALARNIRELAEEPRTDIASRVASVAHRGVETSARHLSLLLPPAALSPRSPMLGAESSGHRREVADAWR